MCLLGEVPLGLGLQQLVEQALQPTLVLWVWNGWGMSQNQVCQQSDEALSFIASYVFAAVRSVHDV